MNDSQEPNHWKSLAADLGAEVPLEPVRSEEAKLEIPAEAASQLEAAGPIQHRPPPQQQRKPPPSAGHWSSLAGDLGSDVPPTDASEDQAAAQHEAGETSSTMRFPENSGNDSSGYEPASLETEALYGASAETEEATDFGDLSEDLGEVSTSGEEESEEKKPRRRRRRRHQPKSEESRKPDADRDPGDLDLEQSSTDEETAQAELADGAEESASQQRPRRRRRGRGRSGSRDANHDAEQESSSSTAAADELSDHELEDDQDFDDENCSTSSRQSHRRIPTWEESIGIIISANMESRTKSVSGDSRRGQGRGGRSGGR